MPAAVLETSTGASEAAWKEVTLLLLGAAADHAVHCGLDSEPFRNQVRESIKALENASESSQILMNAGGVAQAITHYADQTQQRIDSLLADVAALRSNIEASLAEGKFGAVREAARDSLDELAKHAAVSRTQAMELTGNLQDRIPVLAQPTTVGHLPAAPHTEDPTTGLPRRAEAEFEIQRVLENIPKSGLKLFAAVFYLHRMALTNARFGEAIGNQLLLFCSQRLATTVTRANDSLFRWSGPAFVALLERNDSEPVLSNEIQRLISAPFSRFFETSSRSVYLPVKVTADVVPLFDTNFSEVTERIERFILRTSGQGSTD